VKSFGLATIDLCFPSTPLLEGLPRYSYRGQDKCVEALLAFVGAMGAVTEREETDVLPGQSTPPSPVQTWRQWNLRWRQRRVLSSTLVIGTMLLATVVVRGHWLGLLAVMIFAWGSVIVIRDIAPHYWPG
jgi:hypothetical protein